MVIDIDKIVTMCLSIGARQMHNEVKSLLSIIVNHNIQTIMEIGVMNGATLACYGMISQLINNKPPYLIGIDNVSYPGHIEKESYISVVTNDLKSIGINTSDTHFILCDSQALSTRIMVDKLLNGKQIDFLFIDGDHTYSGVKNDFLLYSEIVSPYGIIAIHDILNINKHLPVQYVNGELLYNVEQFWNEIKYDYSFEEITSEKYPDEWHCCGIGVLYNDKGR